MHRLYHHEGERATAKAAEKMNTMFGISTMSNTSIEEINLLRIISGRAIDYGLDLNTKIDQINQSLSKIYDNSDDLGKSCLDLYTQK